MFEHVEKENNEKENINSEIYILYSYSENKFLIKFQIVKYFESGY